MVWRRKGRLYRMIPIAARHHPAAQYRVEADSVLKVDRYQVAVAWKLFPYTFNQSINIQNLYRAPSRSPPEALPTQAKRKKSSFQQLVKLRTGMVWELAYSQRKSIQGWRANDRGAALHCFSAGERDQQVAVNGRAQGTASCARRDRAAKLTQVAGCPAR